MKILTEVSAFDADITMPEDGVDPRNATTLELGRQRLANRTKYLNDQLAILAGKNSAAKCGVTGTTVAAGSLLTLSAPTATDGGWTTTANGLQVPAAGWYLVGLVLMLQAPSDGTDGVSLRCHVSLSDVSQTPLSVWGRRYSTSTTQTLGVSGIGLVNITAPSTQRLEVQVGSSDGVTLTVALSGTGSVLSAVRIT